jgi:hypothetical protein
MVVPWAAGDGAPGAAWRVLASLEVALGGAICGALGSVPSIGLALRSAEGVPSGASGRIWSVEEHGVGGVASG